MLAPLASGSAIVVKPAAHDPVTPRVVRDALRELDAGLAAAIELVTFDREQTACSAALCQADCVIVTGSDEAVAAHRARVPAGRPLHRVGPSILRGLWGPGARAGAELEQAARGFALDVALWDQLGCLSPVVLFVLGEAGVPEPVVEALVAAFDALDRELPRGVVPLAAQAAAAQARDEAAMRAAAGQPVRVRRGASSTLVIEADARLRLEPAPPIPPRPPGAGRGRGPRGTAARRQPPGGGVDGRLRDGPGPGRRAGGAGRVPGVRSGGDPSATPELAPRGKVPVHRVPKIGYARPQVAGSKGKTLDLACGRPTCATSACDPADSGVPYPFFGTQPNGTGLVLDLQDRNGPICSVDSRGPPSMLRISKLTDYGIVLLAHFAAAEPNTTWNAREMAESTGLPLPVVSKMLKTLSASELLRSQRGSKGGYSLVRSPESLSVAEIIEALEGPIALMECSIPGHCEQEPGCPVSAPWQRINRAVQGTLRSVSLADLARPTSLSLPIQLEEPAGETIDVRS